MKKKIDLIEFSRKGGNTTKAKYGKDHFSMMGKKSAVLKDEEFYKRLSALGVAARKNKKKKTVLEETTDLLIGG